ncbi:MAG: putative Holliday junction resolvase-like endonuclease [Arenicella sp.]|jgi:predicted Holliday junction resolvase-like endonuclease
MSILIALIVILVFSLVKLLASINRVDRAVEITHRQTESEQFKNFHAWGDLNLNQ